MPLFGPNIKKMKEANDVAGLMQLLIHKDSKVVIDSRDALAQLRPIETLAQAIYKSENSKTRIISAQILKTLGDIQATNALVNALESATHLGDEDDQVEVMIIIQGRVPIEYVEKAFLSERQEAISFINKPLRLQQVSSLLNATAREGKSYISKWFALLTLIELGDRSDDTLKSLIDASVVNTKAIDRLLEERRGQRDFALYVEANKTNILNNETIRALSVFKSNPLAEEILMKIFSGELLRGEYVHDNYDYPYIHVGQENSICAIGALGAQNLRERIEYLASRGNQSIRKYAKVSLEQYGKATYDEIKAKAG